MKQLAFVIINNFPVFFQLKPLCVPSISQQPFGNQGVQGVDRYPHTTLFVKKTYSKMFWTEGDREIGNEMKQFLFAEMS
jgi:hypothetical protein